ncbi:response regulator [Leptolyngbya sp. FACHB-321]|uniref:response regulator n=1 Tax=Leptolyngbya sp. FACHB-321 TaxID=2692807 RepID=UPI001686F33E|nr:response regulator [Leptolyngbya sp. FACHB-321]MBD2036181.1 response regulator [Leptolyngbya sp. FACHB-321]
MIAMFDAASLRSGLRVLVVDGHADSRVLLTNLFELYGVETTTATCVREAIASLHQAFPDLLISELLLPGEDGYALISQVKDLEAMYQVQLPTIALTVCTTEHDQIHALTAGFCRHL